MNDRITRTLAQPSIDWDYTMSQWQLADLVLPTVDGDIGDLVSEAYCSLENRLLKTPAPDFGALRWKLHKLLALAPDGTSDAWAAELVEPVLADIDRLLAA